MHALLCDGSLTACAECEASLYPDLGRVRRARPAPAICAAIASGRPQRVYERARHHRAPLQRLADRRGSPGGARASPPTLPADEIEGFTLDGLAIGEHAYAGALRFFATGSLDDEPQGEAVLRRYLESALLTAYATRRLLRDGRASRRPCSRTASTCRGASSARWRGSEGVHVSTWNVAYRKRRFIFSHDDTYHHTLMTEPREHWEHRQLSPAQERELMHYLGSRREGLFDWIVFHRPTRQDPQAIARRARPRSRQAGHRPADQRVVGRAAALPGQRVSEHARVAGADLRVLRHAPGSAAADSRAPGRDQRVSAVAPADPAELRKRLPQLGRNIIVVPPESGISTYALMSLCNAAIIYGTKMGVELTSVGLPVIVAGEAWIRNKGITHDASSPEEYFRILDAAAVRGPPRGRPAGARPPLRLSLLLQSHDSARRSSSPRRGIPIYRLKLDSLAAIAARRSPGWIQSATGFSAAGHSCSSRTRRRRAGRPVTVLM